MRAQDIPVMTGACLVIICLQEPLKDIKDIKSFNDIFVFIYSDRVRMSR